MNMCILKKQLFKKNGFKKRALLLVPSLALMVATGSLSAEEEINLDDLDLDLDPVVEPVTPVGEQAEAAVPDSENGVTEEAPVEETVPEDAVSEVQAAEAIPEVIPEVETAETEVTPDGEVSVDGVSPEDAALQQLVEELNQAGSGREAAASYYHERGLRMLEDGDAVSAVAEFQMAVDYAPENETYRASLHRAGAIAGTTAQTQDLYAADIADGSLVEQQRLWIEIEGQVSQGVAHLTGARYNQAEMAFTSARVRLNSLPYQNERSSETSRRIDELMEDLQVRKNEAQRMQARKDINDTATRKEDLRRKELKLEVQRVDAMLARALQARTRRDYDECILYCEQVLKINRAEPRAHALLVRARRERHIYVRQLTAVQWDEQHRVLSEDLRKHLLPQFALVEYSPEWDEIDRRRSTPTRQGEAEEESWREEIQSKLDQKVSMNFEDTDMVEVVKFLQDITDVNIILDNAIIAEGDVPPIRLQVDGMELRNALDFIMQLSGLQYVIKNEAIFISSEEGVVGSSIMKIYDIADLMNPLTPFAGPKLTVPTPGEDNPMIDGAVEAAEPPEVDFFIELIQRVIESESWEENDEFSIDEHNNKMVVNHTANVHKQIDALLRTLRLQRGIQINVAVKWLDVDDVTLEKIGFDWNNYTASPPTGKDPAGLGSGRPLNLGFYWNDDDQLGNGTINTLSLSGYYETTGMGDPSGEGFSGQWQYFVDERGLIASMLIQAVEKSDRGNVSIEPNLTLFNGQRAHLLNLVQQAYIADYEIVGDAFDPTIETLSTGTVLDVQAIASADRRYVTLTLRPTNVLLEQFRTFTLGSAVTASTSGVNNNNAVAGVLQYPINVPQTAFRSTETTVTLPDGGSMLMAGLSDVSSSRSHQGIPFLSHIPFIGRLFSTNGRSEVESKTIITVTANIILFEELEDQL